MGFKIGQKVVCYKKFLGLSDYGSGTNIFKKKDGWYPTVGEIYTIIDFHYGDLLLKECPSNSAFDSTKFKPLDYDFVEQILKKIKTEELETV